MTAAVAPLTLPFAVGLLFGNYDILFPLLYGGMLRPRSRRLAPAP